MDAGRESACRRADASPARRELLSCVTCVVVLFSFIRTTSASHSTPCHRVKVKRSDSRCTHPPQTIVLGAVQRPGSECLPQTLVTTAKRQGFPTDLTETRVARSRVAMRRQMSRNPRVSPPCVVPRAKMPLTGGTETSRCRTPPAHLLRWVVEHASREPAQIITCACQVDGIPLHQEHQVETVDEGQCSVREPFWSGGQ